MVELWSQDWSLGVKVIPTGLRTECPSNRAETNVRPDSLTINKTHDTQQRATWSSRNNPS